MSRHANCPRCGQDISESYQCDEPDVGIAAGWYCDTCDEAYGDTDGPDVHGDDVPIFGTSTPAAEDPEGG